MDTKSIIDYVKTNYPKVVFKPFKLGYKNALGFIVSNGKIIVGYIKDDGSLCKVLEPIDISKITKKNISDALDKIPIVSGFSEVDRKALGAIFNSDDHEMVSKAEHKKIVEELKSNINDEKGKKDNYAVMFDAKNDEILLIKKKHEDDIKEIMNKYKMKEVELENCKKTVITQKEEIMGLLRKYEKDMKEYAYNQNLKADDIQKLYDKVRGEKEILEKRLDELLKNEKSEINRLQRETRGKDYKIRELVDLYEKITSEKDQLKAALDNMCSSETIKLHSAYEDRISEMNSILESYKTQLMDVTNKSTESDSILQTYKTNIEEYGKKLDDYKSIEARLQKDISEKDALIKEYNEKFAQLDQSAVNYEATINSYKEALEKKEKEISDLTAEMDRKKRDMESISTELASVKSELTSIQSELSSTQSELSSAKSELSSQFDYKESANKLENALKIVEEENAKLQKDLQDVLAKHQTYVEELELKEKESAKVKGAYTEIKDAYNKVVEEKERLNFSIKQLSQNEDVYKATTEELREVNNKITSERDELQKSLDVLESKVKELEEGRIASEMESKGLLQEYNQNKEILLRKEDEYKILERNIEDIKAQLDATKTALVESELKVSVLEGYKSRCGKQLLEEKDTIIQKIKQYQSEWDAWLRNHTGDHKIQTEYKKKLWDELQIIQKNLKLVLERWDSASFEVKECKTLKKNAKEIQINLQATVSEQIGKINVQNERILYLEEQERRYKEALLKSDELLANANGQVIDLRKELQSVRAMLEQNSNSKISISVDYDSCSDILQNFFTLNNIFYRKQEIIKKLEDIIGGQGSLGYFKNLKDESKEIIKANFSKVKTEIIKHIQFLDLKKYINSPNFQYLKSKTTRDKVPKEFCDDLTSILEYWNANKANYWEQDKVLTNIYEDLSGAVRVYIRIKPLIGSEQKANTVYMQTVDNKKQRSLVLDCTAAKSVYNEKYTFGEFYGIFDQTYLNADVYTGVPNTPTADLKINLDELKESSDTVSPGIYSSFKQVEDGYSIVLFGYGISGSGKTFTLLGSNGVPGVLHYGLSNLIGLTNIKLKYLFEQYYNAVDINFAKVRGKIYNLVREVPQLRKFARNDNTDFLANVPSTINLESLSVNDLYILTDIIEKYRIEQGRIKATPNNPVSSRSHLFLVFEITFDTGKIGYITIVDTAGRESPIDIYNTFIDTGKTKLASIMAPSGGVGLIEKTMREGITQSAENILEILKESFYINETINHLVYYFNQKNYKKTKVSLQSSEPEKYDVSKYYVKPYEEESIISESNNCLMIPILKFLDSISNKKGSIEELRPTKFITLLAVRQEDQYCDGTKETLEFAQTIKSS
uniref:Kinesin motor domain-containing protein n=1 Tax=viral metagenome TaxID=1070528 RepID=A0A6C0E0Q7_9ZZZZ